MSLSLRCRPAVVSPASIEAFAGGARLRDPEAADPLTWLATADPRVAGGMARRTRRAGVPAVVRAEPASKPDLASWSLGHRSSWSRTRVAGIAAAVPLALAPAAYAQEAPEAEAATVVVEAQDLSYTSELVWAAMQGNRVEITLSEGVVVAGVLLTQADGEIALARDPDGEVVRVPKALVMRVRLLQEPEDTSSAELQALMAQIAKNTAPRPEKLRKPPNGIGPTIVGSVLSGIGGGMVLTYVVGSVADSSFPYYGLPLMFIGNGLLAPGIPLLVTGVRQKADYQDWKMERDLSVSLAPTANGFNGQISLKF